MYLPRLHFIPSHSRHPPLTETYRQFQTRNNLCIKRKISHMLICWPRFSYPSSLTAPLKEPSSLTPGIPLVISIRPYPLLHLSTPFTLKHIAPIPPGGRGEDRTAEEERRHRMRKGGKWMFISLCPTFSTHDTMWSTDLKAPLCVCVCVCVRECDCECGYVCVCTHAYICVNHSVYHCSAVVL